MALFNTLSIIGPGLIGSSILRKARENNAIANKLIVADNNPNNLKRIEELNLADVVTEDLTEAAKADCVIICVPVGAVENVAQAVLPHMPAGAILSDVASVRGKISLKIQQILPQNISYVPGHPMAGTEHSGPDAGFSKLFENRWCLLVPPPHTDPHAIHKMEEFWALCGAKTNILADEKHDRICAMVSHLPHLLAFTICDSADNLSGELKTAVLDYAASGFMDFTRIAGSDPIMWRDIFIENKDAILDTLDRFILNAETMAQAIREGDGATITNKIEHSRQIRRKLIENKQV
ncbi:prephenate dehydrogenase/arogenate dehydrogenase family protein [Swingsia samuiensis]|uniref:prephenate dehydrogenase n=1 Tax=Swingsia samuiensis TaxID=1293412 RepID=A0A4Y6UJK2_9PROT|nr:prephenate dehydrogenase/arogenate dehydrogenase family protein [Swingsia samuiensis]QDH17799.1 prephenate dehydrogenase/arogenate dehydrogenase family protein [Swingsia samuiensis]